MSSGSLNLYPASDLGGRTSVEYMGRSCPAPSGSGHAESHQAETFGTVSVRTEDQLNARLDRHPAVGVLEVETPGIGVHLKSGVRLRCVLDHGSHVQIHRVSSADESARRVADTCNVGIIHRLERAGRYLLSRARHAGMHRRNHEIKLGKQLIFEVHLTVGQNIHLTARKDREILRLFVQFANLPDLPAQLLCRKAAGDGR